MQDTRYRLDDTSVRLLSVQVTSNSTAIVIQHSQSIDDKMENLLAVLDIRLGCSEIEHIVASSPHKKKQQNTRTNHDGGCLGCVEQVMP